MQLVLHGALAEEFAALNHREWATDNVAGAIKLLNANTDGAFYARLRPMELNLYRDSPDGSPISERHLSWHTTSEAVHVVPAVGGSGRTAMTIIGTIIIAAAAAAMIIASGGLATPMIFGAMTAGEMLLIGGALVLGGLMTPAGSDYEAREGIQSTTYQGGLNRHKEGSPVPLVLGRKVRAGGVVISTGLDVIQDLYVPPGSDTAVVA